MLRGIFSITALSEMKAFRLLSTTATEVSKFDEVKSLLPEHAKMIEPGNLAKLVLATRYIKNFQSAIILHVSNPNLKTSSSTTISKA